MVLRALFPHVILSLRLREGDPMEIKEYEEAFGEQFPLMLFQGAANEDIVAVVDACLEAGRPYEADLEDGAKY